MHTYINRIITSKIFKDSSVYTILNFVEKAIPFLILPLITRMLSSTDVGYFVFYQAIVEVLMPIFTFNIDATVLLNYYKLDERSFNKYFTLGFILFCILFLLMLTVSFFIYPVIQSKIIFSFKWFMVICLIVAFRFFTQFRQNLWRVKYKLKQYGFFTIGISLLKNTLGLGFIYFFSMNWEGLVFGHLIGYFIFSIFSIYTFYFDKIFIYEKNIKYIQDLFKVGIPLSLHRLGLWMGDAANRIIITSILGAAATGSYGIGATFGLIVTITEDAFTKAFVPHLFDKLKNISEQSKAGIVKLSYSIYVFLTIVAILVFIIGYYGVEIIYGKQYADTKDFILPLIIAALFKGYYKLHVNYIMFTKKTLKITQITIFTGVINIALSYILVKTFGIIGAAYSLLMVNIMQYVLAFYVGNRLIKMPWLRF